MSGPKTVTLTTTPGAALRGALRVIWVVIRHPRTPVTWELGGW